MAYQFGGLTLANVGDIITQTSVSTNFQTVLRNSAGPAAPVLSGGDVYREGQTWYNTTTKVLSQWDGTAWVGIGGGAAVSATAPTLPQTGQLWYDTVDNQLKVYDGTNWDASAATTPYGATAPTSPVAGDLWYDTNAPATLKVYNGTAWTSTTGTFEALSDVDVASKVTLESGIMWNAAAVQGGVVGQWVTNQIYDASPTGGASNDF